MRPRDPPEGHSFLPSPPGSHMLHVSIPLINSSVVSWAARSDSQHSGGGPCGERRRPGLDRESQVTSLHYFLWITALDHRGKSHWGGMWLELWWRRAITDHQHPALWLYLSPLYTAGLGHKCVWESTLFSKDFQLSQRRKWYIYCGTA